MKKSWSLIVFVCSLSVVGALEFQFSNSAFAQAPGESKVDQAKKSTSARKRQSTDRKQQDSRTAKPRRSSDSKQTARQKQVAANLVREKAALVFAKRHHPELVELIEPLKQNNKQHYNRAIRELSAASERLAKIKDRLPEKYERDLAAWKLDSRVRLVLARMQMADPDEAESLRDDLRSLLLERNRSRLEQLSAERVKLKARISKLDQTISRMSEKDFVETELKRLERSANKSLTGRSSSAASKSKQTNTRGQVSKKSQTKKTEPKPKSD